MANLLLVDDHSVIRTGMKIIISNFLPHAQIDEAHDGDTAFEKIKQNNFDLVILDVNMPNTDSYGLLSNLLAYRSDLKILMFSMNDEETYAKRYLQMGAMGYIRKDAPDTEIVKAITSVLSGRRYISPQLGEQLLNDLQGNAVANNPFDKLSPREFEIVRHLISGESLGDICRKLKLHTSTVGTHKARIFEKLHCSNIIDLNNLARQHHITMAS